MVIQFGATFSNIISHPSKLKKKVPTAEKPVNMFRLLTTRSTYKRIVRGFRFRATGRETMNHCDSTAFASSLSVFAPQHLTAVYETIYHAHHCQHLFS